MQIAGRRNEVLRPRMPDLVIGGRRSWPARPWRAGVIAIALLGVALVVAYLIYKRSVAYEMPGGDVRGELAETPNGVGAALTYNGSTLEWLGGLPVLRATGDAHAIGAAHGRLLAPRLAAAVRAAMPSIEGTVSYEGL